MPIGDIRTTLVVFVQDVGRWALEVVEYSHRSVDGVHNRIEGVEWINRRRVWMEGWIAFDRQSILVQSIFLVVVEWMRCVSDSSTVHEVSKDAHALVFVNVDIRRCVREIVAFCVCRV